MRRLIRELKKISYRRGHADGLLGVVIDKKTHDGNGLYRQGYCWGSMNKAAIDFWENHCREMYLKFCGDYE